MLGEVPKRLKGASPGKGVGSLVAAQGFKSLLLRYGKKETAKRLKKPKKLSLFL